tara:strand:+ start:46 stop:258 length:213 start_codon:yes stop_codon:yes gene_type:complete
VKVGDLIELSAYGKRLTCNHHQLKNVGLVVGVDLTESLGPGMHPMTAMTVRWMGHEKPIHQIRRDLKHAK